MRKTLSTLDRYARHYSLPGIGREGQERLRASRVLVVGAGGLGCPSALYLTAAGIGTLGLAEFDTVETSNLQRQILYKTDDDGEPKLSTAMRELSARNPDLELIPHSDGITPDNAVELMGGYDVVLDGSDNFNTRYLVNDAAVLAGVPLISASLFQFEGQLSLFSPKDGGPCYRCLFPNMPSPGEVPNCAEAGVLGALCGVVGSLQALEAIKWLTGAGDPLLGTLLTVDAWSQRHRRVRVERNPDCDLCGRNPSITEINADRYTFSCPAATVNEEIEPEEAASLEHATWLDVREDFERDLCAITPSLHIPLKELPRRIDEVNTDGPLVVYCHHGMRSLNAVRLLHDSGRSSARSLAGGIDRWALEQEPELSRY